MLRPQGYRLKVYDCYRPRAVQYEMWKIMPAARATWRTRKFGSNHNRGAAVDLTLATLEGSGGGDAHAVRRLHPRGAPRLHRAAPRPRASTAKILREAMEGAGFKRNKMEWWHYDLPGAKKLPVLDVPFTPPQEPKP